MTTERAVDNFDDYEPIPLAVTRPKTNGAAPVRVMPHDLDAERAVISACLYADTATVDNAAHLDPADFFSVRHATIWSAILDLHAQGVAADASLITVERQLVLDLATSPLAHRSNVANYANKVATLAYQRRLVGVAAELADQAYVTDAVDVGGLLERVARPTSDNKEPLVADFDAALSGNSDPVLPTVFTRDDRATCLLYGPGINWLSGEPGKGKSMLAFWGAVQEMMRGNVVVYLDWESDQYNVAARMNEMGLDHGRNMRYVGRRGKGAWETGELAELRALLAAEKPAMVVIDSVAAAMESENLDPESNRDVEKWVAAVPSWAVNAGAAVVCIDHVTKNTETRGRWMIGAQRKMGRADLALSLVMRTDAGVGRTGYGKLMVEKDKEGGLSPHQVGKTIAEVAIISEVDADDRRNLTLTLKAPEAGLLSSQGTGPTWYMEQVSRALEIHGELGVKALRDTIGKTGSYVDKAVDRLLEMGHIERVPAKGNNKPFRLLTKYRQPEVVVEAAPVPRYEAEDDDGLF